MAKRTPARRVAKKVTAKKAAPRTVAAKKKVTAKKAAPAPKKVTAKKAAAKAPKKLTRDNLQQIAEEMNEVMKLEPPIDLDQPAAELEEWVKLQVEDVRPADMAKFSEDVVGFLGYFESKLSNELDQGFALPEAKAKKKAGAKKKDKEPAYRRIMAIIEVVDKMPKAGLTKDEIMKKSNELVVKNGGKSNPRTNDIHSNALTPLVHFGVLVRDGKSYKKA